LSPATAYKKSYGCHGCSVEVEETSKKEEQEEHTMCWAWAIVHVFGFGGAQERRKKWMLNPIQSMPPMAHSVFVPMVQIALMFKTERKAKKKERWEEESCGMG